MAHFWIWWILAALLIGLELATGTFYLLALGIAFVFGGLAASLDASLPMQLIVGGALSAIALAAAHYWRKRIAVPRAMEPLRRSISGRQSTSAPGTRTAPRAYRIVAPTGTRNS